VEHKLTKTGRPFGKMVVEDYSGKFEFLLWSEDYLKFKSFLMPGLFLYIEGNVMRKAWGEQNLEFKIRNIDLLNELATKKVAGLALRMSVSSIDAQFIDSLEKLCKKNSGKAVLRMYLKDEVEAIQAELLARGNQIKPTNSFIKELKKLAEVGVITDKNDVRWLTDQPNKPDITSSLVGTNSPTFVLESLEPIELEL
jgi:DNA polymerase-3 subunit alpha